LKTIITSSYLKASGFIRKGELVAFPTETVYGLGANVFDKQAVSKIFKVKKRPPDNPLIVHIYRKRDIFMLASDIPEYAIKLMDRFFPGPLTLVLRRNEIIPDIVTSGLDSVAVRMPSLMIARKFIKACGVPVAAPSANISGKPSPTDYTHVIADLDGKISCILKGSRSRFGLESTVVDCTGGIPVLLRPGSLSADEIRKVVPLRMHRSDVGIAKSPGMKYRHYSPQARVIFYGNSKRPHLNSAYIGILKPVGHFALIRICRDLNDYARNLFYFFRKCDDLGIKYIYVQKVRKVGAGLAIMDRLKKATD